jgi:hypothetical protein
VKYTLAIGLAGRFMTAPTFAANGLADIQNFGE